MSRNKFVLVASLTALVFICQRFSLADDGDTNPGVIPPITSTSAANAVPGYGGQLAYSPQSRLWLVTSAAPTAIMGIMMNEDDKPVGSAFVIDNTNSANGGSAAPKVAYDPIANKFLVIWINYSSGKGNDTIYGQYFDPKGKALGSVIQIYRTGDITLSPKFPMQFDSKNKQFVFTVNHIPGGIVVTVDENGKSRQFPFSEAGTGSPYVAINANDNQYCLGYQWFQSVRGTLPQSSSIAVRTMDPNNGSLGQESFVADDIQSVEGIVYDSRDGKYTVFWSYVNGEDQSLVEQDISTCAYDATTESQSVISQVGAASIQYNETSNAIGIVGQNGPNGYNTGLVLDASSGNLLSSGQLFGGGVNGNFDPTIGPNTTTGTFAAISGEDRKQTKFISNLGWGSVNALNPPGTTGKSANPTVPSKGLPTDLGQFISAIFVWSLRIIGLIVFIRFFWAGFKWFTAAGNSGSIKDAQEIMKNAALGAVVLFAAYLILYSINPDLVKGALNLPGVSNVPAGTVTSGGGNLCVHTGFCKQSTYGCSYTGDNGISSDCAQGDTCQPTKVGTCTAGGEPCTIDGYSGEDSCGQDFCSNTTTGHCQNNTSKVCNADADCK